MLQGFILLVCVYACETPWNGTVSKRESFRKSAAVWGWWIGCTPVYRGQMIHRYLRRVVCSRCLLNMCQKFRFHVSPIAAGTQKQKRKTEKWEPEGSFYATVKLMGSICWSLHWTDKCAKWLTVSYPLPFPFSFLVPFRFQFHLHLLYSCISLAHIAFHIVHSTLTFGGL